MPVLTAQPETRESIEERISGQAWRFDLRALIELLSLLEYRDGDIELRSHVSKLHQSAVVSAVQFFTEPRRRVVITVNIGLLAPQSPLPSYFHKFLEQQQQESLTHFLSFFDHHLLRALTSGQFPERDPQLFSDWSRSLRQLRSLLGLRSLSTIHWVVSLVFPEMEVAVKRTVLQRSVRTAGMVLGNWTIGDGAACGGLAQVPVSAVAVTLLCDEAQSGRGRSWASEASARLRGEVFPALAVHGLFLQVVLVMRDQTSFMVLQPEQYLGYEPISEGAGRPAERRRQTHTVVLWSGEVPLADPSSSQPQWNR